MKKKIKLALSALDAGDPVKALALMHTIESTCNNPDQRKLLEKAIEQCEHGNPEESERLLGLLQSKPFTANPALVEAARHGQALSRPVGAIEAMRQQYVQDSKAPDGDIEEESTPEHWSSPNGCHEDCPACAQRDDSDDPYRDEECKCDKCGWRFTVEMIPNTDAYKNADWFCPHCGQGKEKPYVVIFMNGGLVQSVLTDTPIEVLKLDFDTEGADEDEIHKVPEWYGQEHSCVSFEVPTINVERTKEYIDAARKLLAAK